MSSEWTKSAWVTEFINVLVVQLRPDIGRKFACTVALNEWVCDPETEPASAAKAWAAWAESGLGELSAQIAEPTSVPWHFTSPNPNGSMRS